MCFLRHDVRVISALLLVQFSRRHRWYLRHVRRRVHVIFIYLAVMAWCQ